MRTHHHPRRYRSLLAISSLCLLVGTGAWAARKPEAPAIPPPPGAGGTYQDSTGAKHDWKVNPSFTLLWNGAPYLPAGIVFTPKSLAEPESPEAWAADQEMLHALKQAGVSDVLVRPAGGQETGASAKPNVPAWQRLVDGLEAEGLQYGIALAVAAPPPASGYSVRTGTLKVGPTAAGGPQSIEIRFPGLTAKSIQRVACAITDHKTQKLMRVEWASLEPLTDGVRATVNVLVPPGAQYVVEMTPLVTGAPGLPDFWNGFDDARDSLLPMKALKFGPGLRFLTHPFDGMVDLEGMGAYVIPNSDAYRLAFEAFLTRKYRAIGTLRSRWAFRGETPATPEAAARLVPISVVNVKNDRLGYLLDEKEQRCYLVDTDESAFWYDHLYFREDSLREQMNNMAQFLRDQFADVPVVIERTGGLRHFQVNTQPIGGFTGIGIRAGAASLLPEAGLAMGAARMAPLRPWCVALGVAGYDKKETLFAALESLRRIGMKGWFVDAGPAAPSPAAVGGAGNLLAWLAEYSRAVAKVTKPVAAEYAPRFVLYPSSIAETGGFGRQHPKVDVATQELAPGIWWIPTLSAWQAMDLGEGLRAYAFSAGLTDEVYLWSPEGKQRIHLRAASLKPIELRDATGKVLRRQMDGGRLRLDLTEKPLVLTGLSAQQVVPIEVVLRELDEFERLVKLVGIRQGEVNELQRMLKLARDLNPDQRPREVRNLIRMPLTVLRRLAAEPGGQQ